MRSFFVREWDGMYDEFLFLFLFLFILFVLGSFKFCDFDGDGWISIEDLIESIELIHQLMGNMFNLTIKNAIEPIDDISEESEKSLDIISLTSNTNLEETFTPQNRAKYLFNLMDDNNDGKADYNDFKRVVLADAEIIRGFLVYDGVI